MGQESGHVVTGSSYQCLTSLPGCLIKEDPLPSSIWLLKEFISLWQHDWGFWLLPACGWSHSQVLGATHSSLLCGLLHRQFPPWLLVYSRASGESLYSRTVTIIGVTSYHLCHILLNRSKSQVAPASERKESHKTVDHWGGHLRMSLLHLEIKNHKVTRTTCRSKEAIPRETYDLWESIWMENKNHRLYTWRRCSI